MGPERPNAGSFPEQHNDHESCRYFVQGPHRKAREMQSAEHKGGGDYGTKDSIPF